MINQLTIVCVVNLVLYAPGFATYELTPDQVRSQYRLARPRLEAIWETPAQYTFKLSIKRTGIPPASAIRIQQETQAQFHIFGKKDHWRIDSISIRDDGLTSQNVVVSTKNQQFMAAKGFGEQTYKVSSSDGQTRIFTESQKTIAGLCELAFVLPTRVDVADILLTQDYKLKVISAPENPPEPEVHGRKNQVVCEFERTPKSDPSEKITRLIFETGQITFLPDRDWAIDHYTLRTNTGLRLEGHVEYQQIQGMNSRVVPKRVEFTSTTDKSSLETSDVLEAVSIIPGPIDDRLFSMGEFQPKYLDVKQSEGWNIAAILIVSGVMLVLIAIVLRILFNRKSHLRK